MAVALMINPLITDYAAFDKWLYPMGLDLIGHVLKKYANFEILFLDFLRYNKDIIGHYRKKHYGQGRFHKQALRKVDGSVKDQYQYYSVYGMPENILLEALKNQENVDVILITSLMSYWYEGVMMSIKAIRKIFNDTPIIVGGMWPIHYRTHCFETLRNMDNLNICFVNEINALLNILDTLGLIDKPLNLNIYHEFQDFVQGPIPDYIDFFPIITSLGCRMKCDYCLSPVLHHGKHIKRKMDNVLSDLINGCKQRKDIVFFDDALLLDKDRFIKPILHELYRRKLKKNTKNRFHLPNGIHTSKVDEEIAFLFKKLDFKTIRVSVEGFDPCTTSLSDNKISFERFTEVIAILEKAGIQKQNIGLYLLFGLPGQDFEAMRDFSLEWVRKGYYIGLSEISPVPGTKLFDACKKEFPIIAEDPNHINNSTFILNFTNIKDKFLKLKKEINHIRQSQ